jgi:hypothetical protein
MMKGDLTIKDEGKFWGNKVTPETKEGIAFCKKWNRGIEMKSFSVSHVLIDGFVKQALAQNLLVDSLF